MKLEENDMKAYGQLHTILGLRKQFKLLDIAIHEEFSFHVQCLLFKYMEESCPFSLFLKELKKRRVALQIYIGIKKEEEEEKLGRIYEALEMNHEYLLWMLKRRRREKDPLKQFDILEKCLEFSIFHKMKSYTDILCDEINLLNFQMENQLSVKENLMNSLSDKMLKRFHISPKRKLFYQLKQHKNNFKELKHLYENLNQQHPSNTFWKKKKKIFELEFFLNYLFQEECIKNEEIFHYFILKETDLPLRLFYCVQLKQYHEAIEVCLEMKNKNEWMKLRNHIQKYTPNNESLLFRMDSVDVNSYSWRMKNLF
jgi:hypothetical protein